MQNVSSTSFSFITSMFGAFVITLLMFLCTVLSYRYLAQNSDQLTPKTVTLYRALVHILVTDMCFFSKFWGFYQLILIITEFSYDLLDCHHSNYMVLFQRTQNWVFSFLYYYIVPTTLPVICYFAHFVLY